MTLTQFSKDAWTEVYNRIIGAVVFLDDSCAECLHWDGGYFKLKDIGADAVKSLSPFEFAKPNQKKAVFLTQATSVQLQTVREIIKNSQFTHCILVSTVDLDILYLELNDGQDVSDVIKAGKAHAEATKQLEGMLSDWIDKKPSAVEVLHIPLTTINPSNVIFLMPPFSNTYPSFGGKLMPDSPNDLDLHSMSKEERAQVRRLASAFNSMFQTLDFREDIYYLGNYSSLVAGVLENSPVCLARRKKCKKHVSLILLDRTLDLCGVTSHSMESILDKVMTVLPRFPGHTTDVAVDMSPLCEANVISVTDDVQLSPGCLYHEDAKCKQTFEHMIHKSQKEVMLNLYNQLSQIDVQKSPGPKNLLKVTTLSIEKIIKGAKGNYKVIESSLGLLQQALGVVQTLKSPQNAQIELMMSLQKQVQQNIITSRESTSVLNQICHLLKNRKERNLPIERLLALLVHIYSLTGEDVTFSQYHETLLQETLSVVLFEEQDKFFPDTVATPEECGEVSRNIMTRLKDIAKMRKNLTKYKSVLSECEGVGSVEYRAVSRQLADKLVHPVKLDHGLARRGDSLRDMLRSGLHMLTSKKKVSKHPLDNPTVLIFIIGGVTAEECNEVHRSIISSGVDNTVIVGSTKFVTPVDAMRDALAI